MKITAVFDGALVFSKKFQETIFPQDIFILTYLPEISVFVLEQHTHS